jgi:hypothetical protein
MSEMNGVTGVRRLAVYAIPESKDGEKKFWPKIGIAYPNRDGSMTLYLEALPLGTNTLQVREMKPPAEPRAHAAGGRDFETVEVRP